MDKIITQLMLFALVLFFSLTLIAQSEQNIEKYSKVKISIQDKSDLTRLQQAGLSLGGMKLDEQSVELILSGREIMKLDDLGFSYLILIEDMTKYYQERSRRTESEMKILEKEMKEKYRSGGFGFGSMGGYYTYDEVVAELDSMVMLYPNLITAKYSIGTTLEGRTIWAVKLSDNPNVNEPEPQIFYNSLIHAREPAGMMSVIYFMYYLLENYGSDSEVNYLVDSREMYFVPIINPDGYAYNQLTNPGGGGMWRKNRKDNGNGCYGVDNNRNFGYMWGYDNIGSSPDPCALDYRGTTAFSELENQIIRDFCNDHNFLIANNYHAYWDVVFTPWGYNLTQTPDSSIYNQTISLGTTFNEYLNGNFYVPGNYPTNGDVCDWMYGEQTTKPKIFAYLTEVGNNNDGFWPIPERIFPLAEENVYLNKVLAWGPGVIDNPPYIIHADIDPSRYVPPGDSILITAEESNPNNYNSVVTAYIINSEDSTVDEFELSKIDTHSYSCTRVVPVEENIYHILLKDNGFSIPSNFYFKEDSRFTTAGPIVIDSLIVTYNPFPRTYTVKGFVKNNGQSFTVENISILMTSDDSAVTFISGSLNITSLAPGERVMSPGGYTVRVDTNYFSGVFEFNFNIKSSGRLYWQDSVTYIVTGVEDETPLPAEFALEQNYPNPFNPSTKIKYSIPQSSNVVIKVFDILGNEIETLVNEEKPVGTYELTWNAASLPSGVYFYQLRAGSFVETKKMLLLK